MAPKRRLWLLKRPAAVVQGRAVRRRRASPAQGQPAFIWVLVAGAPRPVEVPIAGLRNTGELLERVQEKVRRLRVVDADFLQLFRSQAAQQQGDAALWPDCAVSDIIAGNSAKDPLYLDYTAASNVKQAAKASGTECDFAKALATATFDGNLLTTAEGSFIEAVSVEVWNARRFYVRPCYKDIVDLMCKRKWPARMSILGSSGIGKSNIIPYLIWRRWQDQDLKAFPVFVHRDDSIVRYERGREPTVATAPEVRRADPWSLYIIDSDVDQPHFSVCPRLWITSARRTEVQQNTEHFKVAFNKGGRIFMPPWTLEEMLDPAVMGLHGVAEEKVRERFARFGGTSRRVLRQDPMQAAADNLELDEALGSQTALEALSVTSDLKTVSVQSHLLVKLHPSDPELMTFKVNLSSPYVSEQLVASHYRKNRAALWRSLDDGYLRGYGGYLFEELWHTVVQDPHLPQLSLRGRRLRDQKEEEVTVTCALVRQWIENKTDLPQSLQQGRYYQPRGRNFQGVDGWSRDGFFQTTIRADATHQINAGKAPELAQLAETLNRFYFVVPCATFDKWVREQQIIGDVNGAFKQLEQWALCLEPW